MRPLYIVCSLLLLLSSCAHTRQTMLLGDHPRRDLEHKPFKTWFDKNYAAYSMNQDTIQILQPLLTNLSFEIFMGTWCPDSRREVPRMLKMLDACHVPSDHIRIIMVDYRDSVYKQSPGHEERGRDIEHVPDLLVFDQGVEKGRIVESPVVTLPNDLLAIATGTGYTPHYAGTYWLSAHLDQYPIDALADSLRNKPGPHNLLTYGKVLCSAGDTAHAVFVWKLSEVLYPKDTLAPRFLRRIHR